LRCTHRSSPPWLSRPDVLWLPETRDDSSPNAEGPLDHVEDGVHEGAPVGRHVDVRTR